MHEPRNSTCSRALRGLPYQSVLWREAGLGETSDRALARSRLASARQRTPLRAAWASLRPGVACRSMCVCAPHAQRPEVPMGRIYAGGIGGAEGVSSRSGGAARGDAPASGAEPQQPGEQRPAAHGHGRGMTHAGVAHITYLWQRPGSVWGGACLAWLRWSFAEVRGIASRAWPRWGPCACGHGGGLVQAGMVSRLCGWRTTSCCSHPHAEQWTCPGSLSRSAPVAVHGRLADWPPAMRHLCGDFQGPAVHVLRGEVGHSME